MSSPLHEASAKRPGLPAPDAALEAWVAGRAEAARGEPLDFDGLLVAFHASRGQPQAVSEIERLLDGLRPSLRRTGASDAQITSLVEDLPAELLSPRADAEPRVLGYSGRGPLGAWLRVIAVRALVERRRKERPTTALEDDLGEKAVLARDPELELLKRTYKTELERAFRVAFGALEPDARLLLVQHHKDGLNVDALAALHGIHRSTAARRVASARDAFSREVRAALTRELSVGGETFDSIVRLVQSELSLHLSRWS